MCVFELYNSFMNGLWVFLFLKWFPSWTSLLSFCGLVFLGLPTKGSTNTSSIAAKAAFKGTGLSFQEFPKRSDVKMYPGSIL